MSIVKAKKHLGQHFLVDKNIARKIVESLQNSGDYNQVLEVGPGMGVLTDFLLQNKEYETWLIDIDKESITYLHNKYPLLQERIICADFLAFPLDSIFSADFAIIGNFPYNISSQILFKVLEHRHQIPEVVGMFQKEVAVRIASKPGTKDYGILSVLIQAFYEVDYLFTVNPGVFNPPPKVTSAVIRLKRNAVDKLSVDEKLFFRVVKTAFNQRRKTLRNALSLFLDGKDEIKSDSVFNLRAERLSVAQFIELTRMLS